MAPTRQLLRAATLAVAAAFLATPVVAEDRGPEVFELCVQCHGSAGEGNELALAPTIAGLPQWYVTKQLENYRSGIRGVHPDDVGGLRMYPMSLSLQRDEDLQAVAAYVANLAPVRPEITLEGGDSARGAASYAVCASCHGPAGEGQEAVAAPPLGGLNDWYLYSALEKYRSGARGSNPANPYGAVMRGMAATLADDQAIRDVVAYIVTLGQ